MSPNCVEPALTAMLIRAMTMTGSTVSSIITSREAPIAAYGLSEATPLITTITAARVMR